MLFYLDSAPNFFAKDIEAVKAGEHQSVGDGRRLVGTVFKRQLD